MKSGEKPAIGVFGAGWVGLVTGACFAELGHEVVVRDVIPERIEALRAGSLPLHEPGLAELLERNRERLTFTTELDEVVSAPIMFVCVGTPPTYSGDADLSAVWTVVDHLPALEERAILVMKSTVPVGTGEKVRAALDARGLAHVGYVSNPEFLSEGSAVEDFMHPDRIVVGSFTEADAGTVVVALRAARGSDRAGRRRLRGDDQARRERVPDDADQLHQRDRQRLRGDRRRRRAGREGHRPRPPARAALPARRDRLGRELLPEGRRRAEAARVELRLPLPAPERGDRGERAPEAPRDRKAREAPGQAAREDDRAARARVQAEHRRPARGAVARARLAPARGRRRGAHLGPGRRREPSAPGRRVSATASSMQ